MNDFWGTLIAGIGIGAFLFAMFLEFTPKSYHNRGRDGLEKIEHCQQDLPRNKKCILVAVPEK